jgi:hypothetical protein
MYESHKINEAKYFYSQMLQVKHNPEYFKHNLSAFLSSARSVLQYALEEAKGKSGGQSWYDGQITKSKVARFFKEKRDINIHTEPVSVRKDIHIKLSEVVNVFSDSVSIIARDPGGKTTGQFSSGSEPAAVTHNEPPLIEEEYRFDDWPGSEDVFALCQEYLDELDAVVTDGKARRLLR